MAECAPICVSLCVFVFVWECDSIFLVSGTACVCDFMCACVFVSMYACLCVCPCVFVFDVCVRVCVCSRNGHGEVVTCRQTVSSV